MLTYKLIIEGEPKGKERPRKGKYGNIYTPRTTQEYEKHIRNSYEGPKFEDAVYIKIQAYYLKAKSSKGLFPLKKPDIDNVAKIILDSLNGVAYADDTQIVRLTVIKEWTTDYPRVEVTLKEWGE